MWRALSGDCSLRLAIFALAGFIGFSSPSPAVEFNGTFEIEAWQREPGLVIRTAKLVDSLDFALDGANSVYQVDLFDIWTEEAGVNLGQDLLGQTISVRFMFDAPYVSGTVFGITRGEGYATFIPGALFGGRGILGWLPGPEEFAFGDGGVLGVALTEHYFNAGVGSSGVGFHLNSGRQNGARVRATFSLVSEPVVHAPVPAALPLLTAAIGALFALGRQRRART